MRRMMTAILSLMLLSRAVIGQEQEKLIINPRLKGGLGALPFIGNSKNVREDTMPQGWREKKRNKIYHMRDIIPPNAPPHGLLITGMVPDASKRYVVAVTRDEAEFYRAFPEYKRLIAEGKYMEAGNALHICTGIAVSTKVESFWGHARMGDLPEKAGSFFFEFNLLALREWGGWLTFLSYRPKPGDDVVDFGYGLEDAVCGVLLIEERQPAQEGGKTEYAMTVIKAKVIE